MFISVKVKTLKVKNYSVVTGLREVKPKGKQVWGKKDRDVERCSRYPKRQDR